MSAVNVRETTGSKDEENGQRRFVVTMDEFHAVDITVSCAQRKDIARPDEPVRLGTCTELVSNKDLAVALIQLASQAVSKVGNKI